MPVTPHDQLDAARILSLAIDGSPNDATTRTFTRMVANKVYYACYHYAAQFAKTQGYKKPTKGSVHQHLWDWFKKQYGAPDICTDARSLMKKRIQADYKPHLAFTPSAVDIVNDGDAFFALIDLEIAKGTTVT